MGWAIPSNGGDIWCPKNGNSWNDTRVECLILQPFDIMDTLDALTVPAPIHFTILLIL